MRHRLDAEVALDRLRDLDGAVARGAAGAVRDRDVVRLVVLQDLERAPERGLPLVRLWREELKRKDRPLPLEQVGDAHGTNLNMNVSRFRWRNDVEAGGDRIATAHAVMDVNGVVLSVIAPEAEEDRGPLALAEPLLLQRPVKASLEPSPRTSTPARMRRGPASSSRATTICTGSRRRISVPPSGRPSAVCSSARPSSSSAASAWSRPAWWCLRTFAPARTVR